MPIKINPVTLSPSHISPAIIADHAQVSGAFINFAAGIASAQVALGTLDDAGAFKNLQDGAATVAMTPEQYAQWGTDDNYAVDCFIANLGLVKA